MNARIKWLDHMSFVAEASSGHSVVMDGPTEHGGRNLGPRPMEMVLMGLGGCTAYDVVSILQKSHVAIDDCVVELNAQRADAIPAVFTKIHLHYIVKGPKLQDKHVKRAVELTAEKYCSVSMMLRDNVELSYDYKIEDTSSE